MATETSTTIMAKRHSEDCLPCRLASGFGVIGIGGYLYFTGKKWSPGVSQKIVYLLSIGKMLTISQLKVLIS